MRALVLISAAWLFFPGGLLASGSAHEVRQAGRDVVVHYGVVPAGIVLVHPDKHPEREMHGGKAPKGASHVVVALFDAVKGERIAGADVTATVTVLRGASVTRRPQPMTVATGAAQADSAEFEYRVSPEGRR